MYRFKVKTGYHGVHYIKDTVNHKTYQFINVEVRNLERLCELLNDVIE